MQGLGYVFPKIIRAEAGQGDGFFGTGGLAYPASMTGGRFYPDDFFPWSLTTVDYLKGLHRTNINANGAPVTPLSVDMNDNWQFREALVIDKIHILFSLGLWLFCNR